MQSKKWLLIFFIFSFSLIGSVGFINYYVDPFNIFSHKNRCNSLAVGFNERLQKSAYFKFNSPKNYDAILLGSSRATYYDSTLFKGMNLYNFSFSGSIPKEYDYYLEFAKRNNAKPFSTIILGLDFYTFSSAYKKQKTPQLRHKVSFFFKNYFTLDTLLYSVVNCKRSLLKTTGHRSYDRENIVHSDKVNPTKVMALSKTRSVVYYQTFNAYNQDYKDILMSLKYKNKSSKFIVYTSPLSQEFLEAIYRDEKLLKFYYLWLEEIADVFSKVYCFTVPSKFSENYRKYSLDGEHFYPSITPIVADILLNKKDIKGYGVILDKENIKTFIKNGIEKEMVYE